MTTKFYSKILLFGEYGVIKGGSGLAIPFSGFYGELKKDKDANEIKKSLRLNRFCSYLKGSSLLSKDMDLQSFEDDINEGLYFDSNIPLGHGVGSSGALCASIYYQYSSFKRKDQYTNEELMYLKDMMALMESFYHGSSSGLDCLVSLLNRPLFIKGRSHISLVDSPKLNSFGYFYLFDTKIERKTSPLVHKFLGAYDTDLDFQGKVCEFVDRTDECLDSLFSLEIENFKDCIRAISKIQYLNFSDMIPTKVKSFWLDGIEKGQHTVKLCGAGGGGFFLVHSENKLDHKELMALN